MTWKSRTYLKHKALWMLLILLSCCMMFVAVSGEETQLQTPTTSKITLDLETATDEELEAARLAIVQEQKSRIITKVVLDRSEITVGKGGTANLSATVIDLSEGVKAGKFVWLSVNEAVATVKNGTVKGIGNGTTEIICTCVLSDGTELSARCQVHVLVVITALSYTDQKVVTQMNWGYYQEPTFTPADPTNKTLTYSSSNPDIATVDEFGEVTVKAAGTAVITATTTDGSEKSASYTITIPSFGASPQYTITEKAGDIITVDYYGLEIEKVAVKNSNNGIATINAETYADTISIDVTPIKAGTTNITLTEGDDKTNQLTIAVNIAESAVYDVKLYPAIKYKDAYRYPDKYDGENCSFTGRVLQVMEGWGSTTLRISSSGSYNNVVYVVISNDDITTPILEDDTVTVYGTYDGNYTYETIFGGSVTIPSVIAERINVK